MRKLHPTGSREIPFARGKVAVPGGEEAWTAHRGPAGRGVVRVEGSDGCLWYLAVDAAGHPERLQARLVDGGRSLDATFTFFGDEVLVWRRGGGPVSEAVPLPAGYGLLWPPIAGRGLLLAPAPDDADWPLWRLARVDFSEGGLVGLLETVHLVRHGDAVEVRGADGSVETAKLGANGTVMEWDGPAGRSVELAAPGPAAVWAAEGSQGEHNSGAGPGSPPPADPRPGGKP